MSKQVLKDVLDSGLYVVFCGTAVSNASRQRSGYCAGPGNKFWPILAKTTLTPRQLKPQEYAAVAEFGIGLTDLVKGRSGNDAKLNWRRGL